MANSTLLSDSLSRIVKVFTMPATNKALAFILKLNNKIIVFMNLDLNITDNCWSTMHKVRGDVLH